MRLLQQEEAERIFKSFDLDCLSDIRHLSPEEQVELLAVEYARLFLAPSRLASPHESIQLGETRLWGDSTVEVNNIYKKFGFMLEDSFKDTPDHLSAELSFLAQLSMLEGGYEGQGLIGAKRGVLEVKKHFLKNHLLRWFFSFKDAVSKNAKFSYYRKLAEFLGMILNEEIGCLEKIRDI